MFIVEKLHSELSLVNEMQHLVYQLRASTPCLNVNDLCFLFLFFLNTLTSFNTSTTFSTSFTMDGVVCLVDSFLFNSPDSKADETECTTPIALML